MQKVIEVKNRKTGMSFEYPGKDLLQYAKMNPDDFSFKYETVEDTEEKKHLYTTDELKSMSMKDLQTLAEAFELDCDKRRKESLIDAILVEHGR